MLEKEIQKAVLQYLELKRLCYWRNNTGAMVAEYKGKKRFVQFGKKGSADIFVVKNGNIFGLEIKTLSGKQSEWQEVWQKEFQNAGGIYILCRSIDDVMKIF